MTMTTLSSEGRLRRLCGGMIKRNRSFMLYFGVLLFVLYPMQYMLNIFSKSFDMQLASYEAGNGLVTLISEANAHHTSSTAVLLSIAVFVMTLVMGLAQFGYLHSKKAVDVYHELPVNRCTLALANILAAFATVMAPLAANYLVVLVLGAVKRVMNPLFPIIAPGLLLDLVCWAVVVFAVLCIVAFVAVQVGSIFDNFLFSCELLVVAPTVIYLTIMLFEQMLRGYYYSSSERQWILRTSPITVMAEHYSMQTMTDPKFLYNLLAVGVWLVIALLLLWATMRIYRKRPSELAESSTSRKPLAQLGVLAATYIGAPVCGLLFGSLTGVGEDGYSFVIWSVVFAILIYVLAQVILLRGFKGIKKAVLPGVVTVGLIGAFCMVLTTGGLGFESRLPAASDIQSVNINYRGRYNASLYLADSRKTFEDSSLPGVTLYSYNVKRGVDLESAESIDAVLRLHKVASDSSLDNFSTNRRWTSRILLTYTLQNGRQMTREYNYNELSAVEHELLALENTDEFKQETHPVFLMKARDYASFEIEDSLGFEQASVTNQADMQRLLDALQDDMMAENLLKLEDHTELAPCTIAFTAATPLEYLQLTEDAYNGGFVVVRSSYTNTLRVLEELGLGQFAHPDTGKIAEMRVYYENRFFGDVSPITVQAGIDLAQYTKEMDRIYEVNDQNNMVVQVTDAAQLAQIKAKMFNLGCCDASPAMVTFYDENGSFGGYAHIMPQDLPQAVREQFPEWLQEEWHDLRLNTILATEEGSVGIIGGADGPTEVYVAEIENAR